MADNYDNSGALWKRQSKDSDVAGKKYPQYEGNLTVGGNKKKVAAWLNVEKTKDTQPDISLKISDFMEKKE
tara:strand:+ start:1751 stop:1963 length:213 start_codon:yes stop_codon:yes gene_type:complete